MAIDACPWNNHRGIFEFPVIRNVSNQLDPFSISRKFGNSPFLRVITAVIGGFLAGLGSRWCWGCTVSHGISGIPQLSLASFVAVACMFAVGIGTALLLFSV
jgi:uncharacterized protein